MTGAVNLNRAGKPVVDFVGNARTAWGEALPDWVLALAEEANRTSGSDAAKRIGYSGAVVTQVCRANYRGDLDKVEGKVRGALLGAEVECPVLGAIGRDRCFEEQGKKHIGTSALRTKLYRACRCGCPHSRLTPKEAIDG